MQKVATIYLVLEASIEEQGYARRREAAGMAVGRHGGRNGNHLPKLQLASI
jgi:hypothetical protein